MSPWIGILIATGAFFGLIIGCRVWARPLGLSPELSRKIIHIGLGLTSACFPFLFSTLWPVIFIAATAVLMLGMIRLLPALKKSLGPPLHGVGRPSLGEIYFPVAVATVWIVANKHPLFYSLSILVLALADAFAALVGTRYGRKRYTTLEGYKTWEGSVVFFLITFLCIHIPLLLLTDIGRAQSLLLALLIGVLVTIIEAVSWRGLDNLFIPISVCIFLDAYQQADVQQLCFRLGLILLTLALLFAVRSRTNFDDASLLGASLVPFLVVTIGGWQWAVAPVIVFANYLFLDISRKKNTGNTYTINALLAVTMPGFFWLMLYHRYQDEIYFFSYSLGYMAELIGAYLTQWAVLDDERSFLTLSVTGASFGYCMIMVPYLLFSSGNFSFAIVGLSVVIALCSGQLLCSLVPVLRTFSAITDKFLVQGIIGFVASIVPLFVPLG
nr:hypothetical protein [uncultured Desulfobulbus sp.]